MRRGRCVGAEDAIQTDVSHGRQSAPNNYSAGSSHLVQVLEDGQSLCWVEHRRKGCLGRRASPCSAVHRDWLVLANLHLQLVQNVDEVDMWPAVEKESLGSRSIHGHNRIAQTNVNEESARTAKIVVPVLCRHVCQDLLTGSACRSWLASDVCVSTTLTRRSKRTRSGWDCSSRAAMSVLSRSHIFARTPVPVLPPQAGGLRKPGCNKKGHFK